MVRKKVKITNKYGLHARPANLLVKIASKFQSAIQLAKDGYVVNAKSLLGVMSLAAEPGSEIEIIAEGTDEQAAVQAIEALIMNKFEEE